ncbi:protein phosphatase 1 regulatory subunit 12B isoform X3 [Anopheles gambiae]|uniref:Protein phosphatase 1 regulatory subunit 16A n=1 Tax=Anopheles coluzzii TaxID=1518534 RepID=A0A6E8W6D7_ANOCL|nr:protein phosphatase 1 regulatory subunit 12B isoform X3 [Anopheles gambiae]XP_061510026.1 protein phosphatase 1 regulatory subunit 12B isoform X3 [Anopheles gambiae]XP_061510027.1 protein phosphatase 1 regulatory subunit 12B isoform X3 [Anopheles gambiae]XP_061510028.1 protein phosphatase 1 regulatory subunit 12B isoform X3 [Anopheles gambiae]XP_061510029.1 protein phosphatase 1 regulatory subunit 12B isoform X3 [Anopheles gambiae]XP_061510030.1 protein phosphatase 1 regulatory subunit 12B 
MEHADLVAEMAQVEHLSTQDRLHLARMRRAQQLKVAKQKEKEWLKAQRSRDRMGTQTSSYKRHITFEDSVVLLEAAARNDIAEVAKLLQKGVTPDATNMDGLTALHQCCIDDNAEMLNLLLDYGANVNAQDSERWTPLHAAATCGHLNLVKILIARGANLLAVNADGNMPYDICDDEEALDYIEAEMSKRGVTQELIDETRAATETQMLHDLQDIALQGGDLEIPDPQGATPLHIASANGYTRVVEFLLEHHTSTDAVDNDLWTPVHAAACWGHLEVLEMLAQSGADLNAKNKNDETPSDICEDPEIRERIEQLKTEQESKRLAEAQRKRVRRSQSNNTRAQSVRRTSLRDKGLTTKKDAVEEARFRLQAQEGYTTPDGVAAATATATTVATAAATANGDNNNQSSSSSASVSSTSVRTNASSTSSQHATNATISSTATPPSSSTTTTTTSTTGSSSSNSTNSTTTTTIISNGISSNNNHLPPHLHHHHHNGNGSLNGSAAHLMNSVNNNSLPNGATIINGGGGGGGANNSNQSVRHMNSINNNQSSSLQRHRAATGKGSPVGGGSPTLNQYDRRSPDGKDNDETYLIETKGGGASSSPAGGGVGLVSNHHPPTATGNHHAGGHHHLHHHGSVNIPASAAAANGGSGGGGVATVAAATSTTTAAEVYSTSNSENGKINVQVTVLVDPSVAGTLADLKKHRSQNRSSVSPENGSLLSGTAPSLAGSIGNGGSTTPNGANGATPVELSLVSNELQQHHHHHLHHPQHASPHLNSRQQQQQQHYYGDGSVNGTGNGSLHGSVAIGESEAGTPGGTLSKFSGNTSDVVSDSTRSRRCCVVM